MNNLDNDSNIKSVLSIAFPVRIMMIKIMRACVGVKRPQDLWMYNEESEEALQKLLAKYSGPKVQVKLEKEEDSPEEQKSTHNHSE